MDEVEQKKTSSVDGFVSGVGKICSMGEIPDDPVVRVLKRFSSWLKYLLIIEIVGGFIAFVPYYSFKLIREGRTDDLAEFMVKVMEAAHNEEAETVESTLPEMKKTQCPNCGGDRVDFIGSEGNFTEWYCNDCKMNFTIEE